MRRTGVGKGATGSACSLGAALAVLLAGAGSVGADDGPQRPPRERTTQVSIFAGQHVDNSWQDFFDTTAELEYANAGLVGLAWGRDWQRPGGRFSFGFEVQADWQFFDGQHHLEFNLPAVLRYHLPEPVPVLRSFAFELGPSIATEVPAYEVDSRGDSQQFLMYWAMEAEFGPRDGKNSFFTRLHHRSGMFGAVHDDGSSNALVVGLRHRW